jgi:hypothetical protein
MQHWLSHFFTCVVDQILGLWADRFAGLLRPNARRAFNDIVIHELDLAEEQIEKLRGSQTVGYDTMRRNRPRLDTVLMHLNRLAINKLQHLDAVFPHTRFAHGPRDLGATGGCELPFTRSQFRVDAQTKPSQAHLQTSI